METRQTTTTVRLRVSPEVARIVKPGTPRALQLDAARGVLPLPAGDLLLALLFFCHGGDVDLRTVALETLRRLPLATLQPVLENSQTPGQVLDLIARVRSREADILRPLLAHPALPKAAVLKLAHTGDAGALSLLAADPQRLAAMPELAPAILANPQADHAVKVRLGGCDAEQILSTREEDSDSVDEEDATEEAPEPEEELNLSKYQQSLELDVAAKIKIALTGDKEWRSIFIKDANKLVSGAVMKNPRITEGEVLTIAKNKGSNDEMIRLITLNREWIKNYEIQKALVVHARTPLPKALRYMNILTAKDLKNIAKSRGVSQVITNNARRMLMAKDKKK